MEPFENIMMSYKCPKALNELQPCQSNWYCDACQKLVYDFRGMTETEILDTFRLSGQKLCGIYDAQRLNPISQKSGWRKWASAIMVALGIGGFHHMAWGQQNNIVGRMVVPAKPDTNKNRFLLGEIAVVPSAQFPGGNSALQKYLHKQVNYKGGFKGTAVIVVTVAGDGSLTEMKVINKTEPELDNKILNALKQSPKWHPLFKNGQPVSSKYTVQIDFPQAKNR